MASPRPPYRRPAPKPPSPWHRWGRWLFMGVAAFTVGFIVIVALVAEITPPNQPAVPVARSSTTTPTATAAPTTSVPVPHRVRLTQPAPRYTTPARTTTPARPAAPRHAATTPTAVNVASQAPASCYPLTNGGKCYEPGEFCRATDHDRTGIAGDGKRIECLDNDGWRWLLP